MTPEELSELLTYTEPLFVFTRRQAEGAIPNDTPVTKCNSEAGDVTPDGGKGVIVGSIAIKGRILYFVRWDAVPEIPVACMDFKVER